MRVITKAVAVAVVVLVVLVVGSVAADAGPDLRGLCQINPNICR